MARKLRIQYPGAIYPVMNRGDRREAIFEDDEDRERQRLSQDGLWLRALESGPGEGAQSAGAAIAFCLEQLPALSGSALRASLYDNLVNPCSVLSAARVSPIFRSRAIRATVRTLLPRMAGELQVRAA